MSKLLNNAQEIILMSQELAAAGFKEESLAFALAAAQRIQLHKLLSHENV
jgi:hypothetical protein